VSVACVSEVREREGVVLLGSAVIAWGGGDLAIAQDPAVAH
jgi:hypothetical protein